MFILIFIFKLYSIMISLTLSEIEVSSDFDEKSEIKSKYHLTILLLIACLYFPYFLLFLKTYRLLFLLMYLMVICLQYEINQFSIIDDMGERYKLKSLRLIQFIIKVILCFNILNKF